MKRSLRTLALILGAFVAFPATAQNLVARDSVGNAVTLTDKQCTATPWLKDWKAAIFLYEGKVLSACWRLIGDNVVVLDAAGDVTGVPAYAFTRESKT